jgi:hypothetical protein
MSDTPPESLDQAAAAQPEMTFIGELLAFLRHNKKWWLLPVLVVLLLMGLFLFLSGTAAAPFIYTLF